MYGNITRKRKNIKRIASDSNGDDDEKPMVEY